jgi:2OG-Fe(II) oxygenase superfamily
MPVRLTRRGVERTASAADLSAAKTEFAAQHSTVLRGFIEPSLLCVIQRQLSNEALLHKMNEGIGTELRLPSGPLSSALEFLTNDPDLFAAIREVTGCAPIGCFRGRVYRMLPEAGHASYWHSDVSGGRMITMSINLSAAMFDGGELQIRDAASQRMVRRLRNTGAGDAVIFRIDPSLQHQVLPLTGMTPRDALAGWFLASPDYRDMLRAYIEVPA